MLHQNKIANEVGHVPTKNPRVTVDISLLNAKMIKIKLWHVYDIR